VLVVASCHHAHRTRHLRCHGHISPKAKRKAEVERMKQLIIAQNKETAEKEKLARKNKGKGSATKKTFTVNTKLNANAAGTAGGTSKTSVLTPAPALCPCRLGLRRLPLASRCTPG